MMTVAAVAEPVSVSYFERPPYYYTTESGQAAGFLVERARAIFKQAGVEVEFVTLTPYRILYVLQHAKIPHCSIGWFKNSERELFAKFSAPIYRNRALVLLTEKSQQNQFAAVKTLREVFTDSQLIMARMVDFSYGVFADKLFTDLSPKSNYLTGDQGSLLKAIKQRKASYMLVSPEEVDMLARTTGTAAGDLVTVPLQDIPVGNLRYLMCNQEVTDETMSALNNSIEKLYPLAD